MAAAKRTGMPVLSILSSSVLHPPDYQSVTSRRGKKGKHCLPLLEDKVLIRSPYHSVEVDSNIKTAIELPYRQSNMKIMKDALRKEVKKILASLTAQEKENQSKLITSKANLSAEGLIVVLGGAFLEEKLRI
uniref:Uncharacterized protein n=1 Tax=Timema genevievae TaxID=629358 RepID=A0A7R9K1V6_TIMGE|nr:unnamed protein product [Timema genevievae]